MFVLLVVTWFCFIDAVPINPDSKTVSIKLTVPRGYTREQYLKSIVDYWTPERMASAKPIRPMISKRDRNPFIKKNENNNAERILAPSAVSPKIRSQNPSAAGRAFFVMNGQNYACSGSVVNAANRDMVVTAGHCVYDTTTKTWATNWVFIPHYENGEDPFGTYVWREIAAPELWQEKADYNYDVAVVLMNQNDASEHIQDVTGAFGISLNAPKRELTNAFGYPVNINNGQTMSTCVDTSTNPSFLLIPSFKGLQITCDMTGGSSGGPWLREYDADNHSGQQVSLTSFGYLFAPGKINGPHFDDDNIGPLFRQYQDQ